MSSSDNQSLSFREVLSSAWLIYWFHLAAIVLPVAVTILVSDVVLNTLHIPYLNSFVAAGIDTIGAMTVAIIIEGASTGTNSSAIYASRKALGRTPAAIWTDTFAAVIVIGLSLLLIVPGVIWWVYYSFAISAATLRGIQGKAALDYSKSLVRGRWLKVAIMMLVILLPGLLAATLVDIIIAVTPIRGIILFVTGLVVGGLLRGFSYTAMTVLFLNLERFRQPSSATVV